MIDLFLCPHFQSVEKEYFLQVFTKASSIRGENKELFAFTHYPIFLYDQAEVIENIKETQVFNELIKKRIGNFVLAIEGETGTGKSELCIYLGHELEKRGIKILQVSKNSDLMSILADDLPNFYKKNTGKIIKGYKNLKHLQSQLKKNIKLIANSIGTRAIINLTKLYPNLEVDPDNPKIKRFIKFLELKLVQLISRREDEYPSEIGFITIEDLKGGDRDFNFGIPEENLKLVKILNDSVWEALKSEQKIPSLDKLIEEINEELNERWTIIFEDFSITSLDQKKLQNFMERDNFDDKVNFIVAGLADKLRILHTPTAMDRLGERIKFYKTSKSGISQTLFLNEENCIDFIKPYLCYFKTLDGSLSYQRDDIGKIIKIMHNGGDNQCKRCNKCPIYIRDIFPFNEIFLERIYKGIKEEDQKPRKYVEIVGSILEEYIEFRIPPSNATMLSRLSNSFVLPQFVIDLNNEKLNNFIRWYAIEKDGKIEITKIFADLLDIDYSLIPNSVIKEDLVVIPKDSSQNEAESESRPSEVIEELTLEWVIEFDKFKGYVSNWRADPYNNDWFELNTYLTEIISEIFKKLTDNYKINFNPALSIRIGKNERIFTFNDIDFNEELEIFQISLNSEDFTEKELNILLKMAIIKRFIPKEYNHKEILKKIPHAIIDGYERWQKKCYDHLINFNFFKKEFSSFKFNDIAFLYCYISNLIINPWEIISLDPFNPTFIKFKNYILDDKNITNIPTYLSQVLGNRKNLKELISRLIEYSNFSKSFCLNFFKLPYTNVFNFVLMEDYFNKMIEFMPILNAIKSKGTLTSFYNVRKLGNPNRVKLNYATEQVEFKNFFEVLTTFANFLESSDLFFNFDLVKIKDDITLIDSCLLSTDFKKLKNYVKKLETYRSVDRDLIVKLKDLIKKENNIKGLMMGVSTLFSLLDDYSLNTSSEFDNSLKLSIFLAYNKVLYFEDIFNLVKKIDGKLKIKEESTLDFSIISKLSEYLG